MNKSSDDLSGKYIEEIMKFYNIQKNKSPVPAADNVKYPEPELPEYISPSALNVPDTAQDSATPNNSRNMIPDDFILHDTDRHYNDLPEPETMPPELPEPNPVITPGEMPEQAPVTLPAVSSDNRPDAGYGKLSVQVRAGDRALPVENALVIITRQLPAGNELLYVLTTNPSGETQTIFIPAPEKALSETPTYAKPFSKVFINTYKKGFYEVENTDITVFAGITSVLPVNMIPLPFQYSTRKLVFPNTEPDL